MRNILLIVLCSTLVFYASGQNGSTLKTGPDQFKELKGTLPFPVTDYNSFEIYFVDDEMAKIFSVCIYDEFRLVVDCKSSSKPIAIAPGIIKQIDSTGTHYDITIAHNGSYYTSYSKLNRLTVQVGDSVQANTILGSVVNGQKKNEMMFLLYETGQEITRLDPKEWLDLE